LKFICIYLKINQNLLQNEAIIFADQRRGLCICCPNNKYAHTKEKTFIFTKDGAVGAGKIKVERFFKVRVANYTHNYSTFICGTCSNKINLYENLLKKAEQIKNDLEKTFLQGMTRDDNCVPVINTSAKKAKYLSDKTNQQNPPIPPKRQRTTSSHTSCSKENRLSVSVQMDL
jgi:hypothetical protein